MPGPVTDARAGALRQRYYDLFGGVELPVPVEAIAEDLLGSKVEESVLDVSGLLLPADRIVILNAEGSFERRRFTLAHELGHWICHCLEGTTAPVYCRDKDVSTSADRQLERQANVFAAELLMPEPEMCASDGANNFGVSEEAFGWRLFNLGLNDVRPDAHPLREQALRT